MLNSPETLPAPLVGALLAIEELAAPQNRALMDTKLAEARVANPWLDPADSPECLALQLWLLSPYKFTEGEFQADAAYKVVEGELILALDGAKHPQDERFNVLTHLTHLTSMGAIFPSVKIDSDARLAEYFMPHQVAWILAEDDLRAQQRPAFALAEKSVRIGWTYCDAFKNVRKRLRCANRDYLFATKDYPSALEYMLLAHNFARLLNFTPAIVAHGEDYLKVPRLDAEGRPTAFTEEIPFATCATRCRGPLGLSIGPPLNGAAWITRSSASTSKPIKSASDSVNSTPPTNTRTKRRSRNSSANHSPPSSK